MSDTTQPWYVIGHRNPDTDAICAAIGHAAFLNATGEERARAACCGEITERTRLVIERAGLEPPLCVWMGVILCKPRSKLMLRFMINSICLRTPWRNGRRKTG